MSDRSTTTMPADVAKSHDLLRRELSFLNTKWNDYKTLYCTDDNTVQLLGYAASFFFQIHREVLRDDIILTLCRITDPTASTVRGVRRNNLTIEYLISIIPDADSTLKGTLKKKKLLPIIKDRCKKFRDHRNRRVSHYDLDTRLKRSDALLPGIGIVDADAALKSIADVLNVVELYYDNNEQSYAQGIYGSGDGSELIQFIEHEKELQKYFNNKEYGDPM